MMSFTTSGSNLDLFSLTMHPVAENTRSADVDAAGQAVVFRNNRYKFGKSLLWLNHHIH